MIERGELQSGAPALLIGFGAGLSYAVAGGHGPLARLALSVPDPSHRGNHNDNHHKEKQ